MLKFFSISTSEDKCSLLKLCLREREQIFRALEISPPIGWSFERLQVYLWVLPQQSVKGSIFGTQRSGISHRNDTRQQNHNRGCDLSFWSENQQVDSYESSIVEWGRNPAFSSILVLFL